MSLKVDVRKLAERILIITAAVVIGLGVFLSGATGLYCVRRGDTYLGYLLFQFGFWLGVWATLHGFGRWY